MTARLVRPRIANSRYTAEPPRRREKEIIWRLTDPPNYGTKIFNSAKIWREILASQPQPKLYPDFGWPVPNPSQPPQPQKPRVTGSARSP